MFHTYNTVRVLIVSIIIFVFKSEGVTIPDHNTSIGHQTVRTILNRTSTETGGFTFDPPFLTNITEGNKVDVLITPERCYGDDLELNLTMTSTDTRVAEVTSLRALRPGHPSRITCPVARLGENLICWRFAVEVRGIRLGFTEAHIRLKIFKLGRHWSYWNNSRQRNDEKWETEKTIILGVRRLDRLADVIFRYSVAALIVILNFGFGCSLDLAVIKSILVHPVAPIIGFVCQFSIMPLLGFGISKLIPIGKVFGFGLLTSACCPGGGGSNIFCLLLKGDVNLSITMTFVNLCASLAMMPLWLWLLARFYIEPAQVQVPFVTIIISLVSFVIPGIIGVIIRQKKPSIGERLASLIKPISLVTMLYMITFGFYVNFYIYDLIEAYPLVIPPACLLPWAGFALGFLAAYCLRQPLHRAVTISIETGIQNIGVAMVMLQTSFPMPYGDLAAVMPLIVAQFTTLPLIIAYAVIAIRAKWLERGREETRIISTAEKLSLVEKIKKFLQPEKTSAVDVAKELEKEELEVELTELCEAFQKTHYNGEATEGGWIFTELRGGWIVAKQLEISPSEQTSSLPRQKNRMMEPEEVEMELNDITSPPSRARLLDDDSDNTVA